MPYTDSEKRRDAGRLAKRRQRARLKAEAVQRRETERLRQEREADLRARNLVPVVLNWGLEFADRSYPAGTIVRVIPGIVHMLARAHLAEPARGEPVATVTRLFTGTPDTFETEPDEPPKERTNAGY